MINKTIRNIEVANAEPGNILPEFQNDIPKNLDLFDPSMEEIPYKNKIEIAREIEKISLSMDKRIICTATYENRVPHFLKESNKGWIVAEYSMLAKPHWVDMLVEQLKQMVEQKTRIEVAAERVRLIEQAERKITQRVNLFDKILIPTAKKNIKKIQIYLADAERAAVVRSKITKRKRKPLSDAF